MNETNVSRAAQSPPDAVRLEELPPPEGGPAGPQARRPGPDGTVRSSGWGAGGMTALVMGAFLLLVSVVFLGSGGTVLWADHTQRDAGYVTSDVHEFSTAGSALATEGIDLGSGGTGWLYSSSLLGEIRIRVTPASSGSDLFVGIGPSADVDRYLAGVNHTVISDFWTSRVVTVGGGALTSSPGTQDFWVASTTGAGPRTLEWDSADGSWTVVVMNAEGRPGIVVGADLGATVPSLPWIAVGLLVAGGVFLSGGVLLIAGAIRRHSAGPAGTV